MERMTVHEALCEVKVITKRIAKILGDATFIGTKKAMDTKISGMPVEEFETSIIRDYDRLTALILRMNQIKAALSLSNAQTKINVMGTEMSIAEAIYMKNFGISNREELFRKMSDQYKNAVSRADINNGKELDDAVERYITNNFGQKDKIDAKVIKEASEDFRARNTTVLIDPLKLKNRIYDLQKEIDSFNTAIDSAIQVSNAVTIIEICD